MARKTKEDAEKTRSRILASALDLFCHNGYAATSLNDVARRLKMTKGAVYWHFDSKVALFVELIRLAIAKFRRQIEAAMPEGELTFPAVAEMMVQNATSTVSDPRGAAFFRLVRGQVRWSDESMKGVREKVLAEAAAYGPFQTFRDAISRDIDAGRVRKSVNIDEIATVATSLWDGVVQARLDDFLQCDLASALRHAYGAIWRELTTGGETNLIR